MNKELEIFQDKDGNVYNIETELEHKLILCIVEQQEKLDKIKELVDKMPCLWYVDEELERVDGTIDLVYKEYTGWKDILELLEEIE